MPDGPPKSALEIAKAKLAQQDAESGVDRRSLSATQKDAIAVVRGETMRPRWLNVASCTNFRGSQSRTLQSVRRWKSNTVGIWHGCPAFATRRSLRLPRTTEHQAVASRAPIVDPLLQNEPGCGDLADDGLGRDAVSPPPIVRHPLDW